MGPEKEPGVGSTGNGTLNSPILEGFVQPQRGKLKAIFCLPVPSGYRLATFLPLPSTDLRAPGGLSCP